MEATKEPTDIKGKKICWAYVAGFFDGEGNIFVRPGTVQVNFTQGKDWILLLIKCFIESKCDVYRSQFYSNKRAGKGRGRVSWTNAHDVKQILKKMLPYLKVKREEAIKTLQKIERMEPRAKHNRDLIAKRDLEDLYFKAEMSLAEVAARLRCKPEKVRTWMRKYGLKCRDYHTSAILLRRRQREDLWIKNI